MIPKRWAVLGLLMALFSADAAAEEIPLPYRIDPARKPRPNGTTMVLWRFEKGTAADATTGGNHGKVLGGCEPAKGRYGSALRFRGGEDTVRLLTASNSHVSGGKSEGVGLIVDFWCRVPDAPADTTCILEVPQRSGIRLDLTRTMTLRLSGDNYETLEVKQALPPDRWVHIALLWRGFMQPNRIYSTNSGVELFLNGVSAGVAWDRQRYRKRGEGCFLCLGNSLDQKNGFNGLIDEFRVSEGAAGVYALVRQEFPAAARPADAALDRSPRHFEMPDRLTHVETFEGDVLTRVRPPAKPLFLKTVPDVVPTAARKGPGPGLLGEDETTGLLKEMNEEVERVKEKAPPPLEAVDGVRGKGLLVRGGEARIDLPTATSMPDGTLEFWFRPGNWDNLAIPPGRGETWTYLNRRAHVLTLWGVTPEGGDPQPLIAMRVDRADGAATVRPKYRKWFARPRTEIVPHKWMHVLVTWSRRFPHLRACELDGRRLSAARIAPEEAWRTHRAAYVTLGNGWDTHFDELRLYSYPFEPIERLNARASFTGRPMQRLDRGEEWEAVRSLGEFPVETGDSLLHRIAGAWRQGWVTGVQTTGEAKVFFGFKPSIQQIIVAVAPTRPETVASAEVTLQLREGKTAKGKIPAFENGKGGVVLHVGDLPKGTYALTGVLRGPDGNEAGTFRSSFVRVEFPSVGHRLGYLDVPPPPFTPVELEGPRVKAVGRTYHVGSDGNFQELTILGEQILAAPIRFEARLGGKTVVLKGNGPAFGPQTPLQAEWSAAVRGGGITISSRTVFEYDGAAMYGLVVRPEGDSVEVERLSLQIPLKEKYAKLFHTLGPNTGLRNPYVTGTLRPGEGVVWDSKNDAPFLPRHQLGNFVAQMWLGGPVRGLVFYGDNDRGWVPTEDQAAVTVSRKGDVVTLGLHFISQPFTLKTPRRIDYQLLGTPPKPLPKDHRLWARGHLDTAGKVGGRLTSCDSFAPFVVPCRAETFAYWPPDDDWELVRVATERQRNTDHSKYPPGQALMMYHDKNKCPSHPRLMPYYGWSWGSGRYPADRIDHLIWYMNKMIECGYDGIYIDDVFPFGDWNLEPLGTSYLVSDEKGASKQVGSAHGEYRVYLKRLYGLFHAHGKRPIITTHMTSTLGWPYHSFATVAFDCEQSARFSGVNSTFIDAWPLDYMMVLDIPERSGLVTVPMLKSAYIEDRSEVQQWSTRRSYKAVWMLFDHNLGLSGTVLEPYYGMDVGVFPFWRNEHIVTIRPQVKGEVKDADLPKAKWWKSEHFRKSLAREPLRATIYRKQDRCLVIVSNFLRRSVAGTLTFDLAQLGVPAEARNRLRAVDVDKAPIPEGVDLAALHLADLATKKSTAPSVEDVIGQVDGGDADRIEGVLRGRKLKESNARFLRIRWKQNRLTLNVPPHNFRAIELQWGEQPPD